MRALPLEAAGGAVVPQAPNLHRLVPLGLKRTGTGNTIPAH